MGERKINNEAEARELIFEQVKAIESEVGNLKAICFLSGGVDSSVVTVLGHRALEKNLQTIFVDNGLMRANEPEWVVTKFCYLGIPVKTVPAADSFFAALAGKVNPFEKRTAIRETFYGRILTETAQEFGAEILLQGTNLTDIEATALESAAPQHNVLEQIGIDIDLRVIEPLKELRKPSVRQVAKALGLPEEVWNRMPFLGPALAGRISGEVTPQKVEIIRRVTQIVEKQLEGIGAFQCFAVLTSDMVPNFNRTQLGYAVTIVCINSTDAVTALPTEVSQQLIGCIRDRIYQQVPEVLRVAWDFSTKPPAAIEWV